MQFVLNDTLDAADGFYGRDREKQRLFSVLKNKLGGTILVAGDRGAGKTSLVAAVIDRFCDAKRSRWILRPTRDNVVVVDMPFIPKHLLSNKQGEADADTKAGFKADLTSLVLRALVQALVNENRTRRWSRLGLAKSLFRPMGYTRKLAELGRLGRYVSITEKRNRTFGLKRGSFDLGAGREYQSELDLSDTVLELRLRNLFQAWSGPLSFVFVFDELDKLEENADMVNFMLYLKNLFTRCGAHFVFITTETTYSEIARSMSARPYSAEHTLFTERILLNNLEPAHFMAWLESLFHPTAPAQQIDFKRLMLAVAWNTKHHPFDALQLLKKAQIQTEDGYSIDTAELIQQMEGLSWDYLSALELFVDYVYGRHRKQSDDLYNRYLYKAVKTAARQLFDAQGLVALRSNFLTVLFEPAAFASIGDEISVKTAMKLVDPPATIVFVSEDWRGQLYALSHTQLADIEESIQELCWLLNKEGSLQAAFEPGSDTLRLTFVGDGFTVSNMRAKLGAKLEISKYAYDTADAKRILNYALDADRAYFRVLGRHVWDDAKVRFVWRDPSDAGSAVLSVDSHTRYQFREDIEYLRQAWLTSGDVQFARLIELVRDELAQKRIHNVNFSATEKESFGARLPYGKRIAITYNAMAKDLDLSSGTYYINLVDTWMDGVKRQPAQAQFKQYVLSEDWVNYKNVVHVVTAYIAKLNTPT